MGEIADLMLEGALCQSCGEYIDNEGPGHPRYCSGCQRSQMKNIYNALTGTEVMRNSLKCNCPTYHKRVKKSGLRAHMKAVHSA